MNLSFIIITGSNPSLSPVFNYYPVKPMPFGGLCNDFKTEAPVSSEYTYPTSRIKFYTSLN